MATPDVMMDFIAKNVDSDMHYILEEAGIPLKEQYDITQTFRTVRMFSAFADDRPGARLVCKDDYALEPSSHTSPQRRGSSYYHCMGKLQRVHLSGQQDES